MSRQPSFFEELKRRRVVRAAVVYAIVAFGVVQVADLLFPALLLPEWSVRLVVGLVLVGFPVALVLAWAFDLTPEGVRRTPSPRPDAGQAVAASPGSGTPVDARPSGPAGRLDLRSPRATGLVGLGMVIALVAFGGYHFLVPTTSDDDRTTASADARHSIAVLPFTTMAGGEENEYFADGLTEDILTNLGLVPDFTVVSRTSVMRYKGSDRSVPEIARELGVRYVLEGSMRRVGDQVRVVIQLIEPGSDRQIWARTMDRRVQDVFALQSEIAHAVVDALRVELGGGVGDRIGRAPTEDMAAYELFLQGRDFYYQYSRSTMERAIALFRQAVERDPGFALAHAWLGAAQAVCVYNYSCEASLMQSGLASARRAVELQPDLGDAHRALGTVLSVTGRLDAGTPHLERAVELNPNDFAAISNLGLNQVLRGDVDGAIATTYRSIERDPARSFIDYGNLSSYYRILELYDRVRSAAAQAFALRLDDVNASANLAWSELLEGRPADAMARMERLVGEQADPSLLATVGHVFMVGGDHARAREILERAHVLAPDAPALNLHAPAVLLAWLRHQDGETDRAEELLDTADRRLRADMDDGSQIPAIALSMAGVAAIRGDIYAAVRHFERAVDHGLMDPVLIARDPVLAPIRDQPRFQAAMDRMWERQRAQRQRVEAAS
jgi:adenylate cyclase